MSQVKALLGLMQLNLAYAVEVILLKAPHESASNQAQVQKLAQIVKQRINKRDKLQPVGIRLTNEAISSHLRQLTR